MDNKEKTGKRASQSVKIVLAFVLFGMVVAGGLLAVDMNFNNIIDRPERVSILMVDRASDGVYKVNIMGKEKDVNAGACERAFQKTGRLIFAGVSSVKNFISGFLDQAKRCSTIIGE